MINIYNTLFKKLHLSVIGILLLTFLNDSHISAQQNNNSEIPKLTQKGRLKMDFLSIEMPENEDNMSLAGIHYNFQLNDWSYLGIGMYGAVTGIRGGLFTLGVNGELKRIYSKTFILIQGYILVVAVVPAHLMVVALIFYHILIWDINLLNFQLRPDTVTSTFLIMEILKEIN